MSSTYQWAALLTPSLGFNLSASVEDICGFAGRVDVFQPASCTGYDLKFCRLEAIPSAGSTTQAPVQQFVDIGCTLNLEGNVSIMKSPVGSKEYCEAEALSRVEKCCIIMGAIAELPDKHAALYLLRYQIGRMDYLIRTTPASMCEAAIVQFDDGIRCSYQAIVARVLTESQWEHAWPPRETAALA